MKRSNPSDSGLQLARSRAECKISSLFPVPGALEDHGRGGSRGILVERTHANHKHRSPLHPSRSPSCWTTWRSIRWLCISGELCRQHFLWLGLVNDAYHHYGVGDQCVPTETCVEQSFAAPTLLERICSADIIKAGEIPTTALLFRRRLQTAISSTCVSDRVVFTPEPTWRIPECWAISAGVIATVGHPGARVKTSHNLQKRGNSLPILARNMH